MAASSITAEFRITDKISAKKFVKILTSSPTKKTKIKSVVLSQEDAVNLFKARQNNQ